MGGEAAAKPSGFLRRTFLPLTMRAWMRKARTHTVSLKDAEDLSAAAHASPPLAALPAELPAELAAWLQVTETSKEECTDCTEECKAMHALHCIDVAHG